MEITLEPQHTTYKTAARNRIYQWSLQELKARGYSSKVSSKVTIKAMKHYKGRNLAFIQWVTQAPSFKRIKSRSHQYHQRSHQQKGESFIKNQFIPAMCRALIKKGYRAQAATTIASLLITHSGGPENCDLTSAWKATQQWPEC